VATVSSTGVVTGVGVGTATIVATSDGVAGTASITVTAAVGSIAVSDPGMRPLQIDSTLQLTATVLDGSGNPVPGHPVTWASGDPAIATVDGTGLVTGVSPGTVTITATAAPGVSASVSVRVVGHSTTGGNNLSYPVVFAEGIGVTGLPVSVDAGLRPTPAESIAVPGLPFFYSGNRPDYGIYYLQQGFNVWQAEWLDGSVGAPALAEVAWGDNLTHHTFNTHATIRVEVSLFAHAQPLLTGYRMASLWGSGPTEMQGTDGTTVDTIPSIFSVMPRLIIEKLDDSTKVPVFTVYEGAIHEGLGSEGPGAFGSEVNVGGRIIYGFNLQVQDLALPTNLHKYGWYRLTLQLDANATVGGAPVSRNVALDRLAVPADALTYTPQLDTANQVTWLDIYIVSASGGGGGGHKP
jgi:hypothetical protein